MGGDCMGGDAGLDGAASFGQQASAARTGGEATRVLPISL